MEKVYRNKKIVIRDNTLVIQEQITRVIKKLVEKVENELTADSIRGLVRLIGLRPNTIKTKLFLLELIGFDKDAILYAYHVFVNGCSSINGGVTRNLSKFRKFLSLYQTPKTEQVIDNSIEEKFANINWGFDEKN